MPTAAPTPMQGKLKALRPSGSPAPASPWGVSQDVVVSPSTRASTVLVTDIPADVLMPRDGVARSPAGKAKRVLDGRCDPSSRGGTAISANFATKHYQLYLRRYVSVRDSQVLNTFSTLFAEYGTVRHAGARAVPIPPPRAVLNVDVRRATPSSNARGQPRCSSAPACEMTLYCPGVIRHGVEAPAPGNHCRRWRQHHPVRALWRVRTVTGEAATTGLGGRGGGRLRLRLRQDG